MIERFSDPGDAFWSLAWVPGLGLGSSACLQSRERF